MSRITHFVMKSASESRPRSYLPRLVISTFLYVDEIHVRDVETNCLHHPSPPSFKTRTHQHLANTNFNTIKSIYQPAIGYESMPVSFTCVRHMLLIAIPSASFYFGWRFSKKFYHKNVVCDFLILSIPEIRPVCLKTINLSILSAPPYLQSCGYLHH
jgi:hypothetical protein